MSKKILLVCSTGGHLYQLYKLKEFWENYDRVWVSFDKNDARSLLKNEKVYWAYHPTTRSIKNLILNSLLSIKILYKETPDLIISTGAGVAVPFFWLGSLINIETVFIEVFDRISSPTLTGKLVAPFCEHILLQWHVQKKWYPNGQVVGPLL